MGLREKASEYYKKNVGSLSDNNPLALTPEEKITESLPIPNIHEDNWEQEALDELKTKGKISSNELIERITRFKSEKAEERAFLLSDDLRMITQPVDLGFAQQDRLEALYNLLDLCKELTLIEKETELWSTLLFALLGQIGSREAAIFFKEEKTNQLILKAVKGFVLETDFRLSKDNEIEKIIEGNPTLYYVKDMIPKIRDIHQQWLEAMNAELIIPLMRYEEFVGFIILGKPIGLMDYNLDDLLYLKLYGEIVGSFYESISRIIYVSEQKEIWDQREKRHLRFMMFMEQLEKNQNIEEVKILLRDLLFDEFGFSMYIMLLADGDMFFPDVSQGLKEETVKAFEVQASEPWIWENRLMDDWFRYVDFKEDLNLYEKFSAEDFSIINQMYILPLNFEGQLKATFLLFEVEKAISKEDLRYIQAILKSYFLTIYTKTIRKKLIDQLHEAERDPLFALRKYISEQEKNLKNKGIPYSIISFKISNGERLENLLGAQKMMSIKYDIKKFFSNLISRDQYFSEVFPNHFLLILDKADNKHTQKIVNQVFKDIRFYFPLEENRPLAIHRIISRPIDDLLPLEKFLFQE